MTESACSSPPTTPPKPPHRNSPRRYDELDFAEVKGQRSVKRAIEIAVPGSHSVLLIGPPGSGRSMLAKRLPTILPPLRLDEAFESTRIQSVMGLLEPGQALITRPPFRAPHHTTSDFGLLGGNVRLFKEAGWLGRTLETRNVMTFRRHDRASP